MDRTETQQSVQNDPGCDSVGESVDAVLARAKTLAKASPSIEEKARWNQLACDLGKRYSFSAASLERYQVYHDFQRTAIEDVRAHMADKKPCGLILYGPVGTGKDHLLAAALWDAVSNGFTCRWFSGLELFGRFRDAMDAGQREAQLIFDMVVPEILAISDPTPPSGMATDWNIQLLYRIIDRRYRSMKHTWVTINVASVDEADAKLSAQVFDRLREGATVIPCFWPSYRERNK